MAAAAILARLTRSSMLDVLSRDYVRTARAKGLPERVVVWGHALRNALIPVITVIGLEFGGLLAGAFVLITLPVSVWMLRRIKIHEAMKFGDEAG